MKQTKQARARQKQKNEVRAVAYERVNERGAHCVLCAVGVPNGTGVGNEHHEIISKARLPGLDNLDKLYAETNIALACQAHHQRFQHEPLIWMKAMVKLGYATAEDYADTEYWQDEPYPPIQECFGLFGYGDGYFADGIPESVRMAFAKISAVVPSFCVVLCPAASKCLSETKQVILEELRK